MATPNPVGNPDTLSAAIFNGLDNACASIAPSWPLDQLIAVNPYWELRHLPADEVAARVAALAHGQPLMPASYYAELDSPAVADRHLDAAARELGIDEDIDTLRYMRFAARSPAHWHNVSDLVDAERDSEREMAWRAEIIHQISQFCAASFKDDGHTRLDESGSLYARWLAATRLDRGIAIIMGEPGVTREFAAVPDQRDELLATALHELGIKDGESAELYAQALLLDINGWASWAAYLRWQDRLNGGDNDLMMDILAIRVAWELVLWRLTAADPEGAFRRLRFHWQNQLANPSALIKAHHVAQRRSWLWQRAAELAFQEHLLERLHSAPPATTEEAPVMQAAFCIDVRSEVFRRHLEAQNPGIQTLGFAGFFGLPIEYRAGDSDYSRPQLPGLLSPTLEAVESIGDVKKAAGRRAKWKTLGDAPPAMFGLVEASGPLYATELLRNSFFSGNKAPTPNALGSRHPVELQRAGAPLNIEERTELAATVLHAMGLESGFAPLVLLAGHGASTRNNPHAASLDCGACGGQTGALNARLLAGLLNDSEVRGGLAARGIHIPAETRFVAALHNTTTDDIEILDDAELPADAVTWLEDAGDAARTERSHELGEGGASKQQLADTLRRRGQDWSQVRPEWGLAGNAAFIAAPRSRTRLVDLEGRAFLHDYQWQNDHDFSVLELIMTAPMVVAHWINMQYNASVTDNVRFGSGNKVLHNIVGGNIGVFEGNGGDLRIGLPMQSIHDGERWMHAPLRLSVYLDAPASAIEDIYRRHDDVRKLVDNEWLYLFRLEDDTACERLVRDAWTSVTPIGDAVRDAETA